MHIPFAAVLSLALAVPLGAAPVASDIQGPSNSTTENAVSTFTGGIPSNVTVGVLPLELRAAKKAAAKTAKVKTPIKAKTAKVPATKVTKPKTTTKKVPATPAKGKAKPSAKSKLTPTKSAKAKASTKPSAKAKASKAKASAKPSASAKAKRCAVSPAGRKAATTKKGAAATTKKGAATTKKTSTTKKGKRAGITHPRGDANIILFHATIKSSAASLVSSGVDLSRTADTGDFSRKPESDGGFYMADSLIAAAQFACYESQQPRTAKVDIIEYKWSGSGLKVHNFPSRTADFDSFLDYCEGEEDNVGEENVDDPFHDEALVIFESVMITGPLGGGDFDKDLRDDFQQYALVNQKAADDHLVLVKRHEDIVCANVPKAEALTDALYEQTMGGSSTLAAGVEALQCDA